MKEVIGLIAVIGMFSAIIIIAYLYINSRHKIRMSLIEHGQDATIFKEDKDLPSSLKYGMVAIGLGMGLFIGNILDRIGLREGPAYLGSMLMLGGAGLVLYHLLTGKKPKNFGDTV